MTDMAYGEDPRNKLVVCLDWRPLRRNTLVGFAKIKVVPWRLTVDGVAIHEKNGTRWAQLPSRPQVDNGQLVREDDGRIKYAPVMTFESREVADKFSAAVIKSLPNE